MILVPVSEIMNHIGPIGPLYATPLLRLRLGGHSQCGWNNATSRNRVAERVDYDVVPNLFRDDPVQEALCGSTDVRTEHARSGVARRSHSDLLGFPHSHPQGPAFSIGTCTDRARQPQAHHEEQDAANESQDLSVTKALRVTHSEPIGEQGDRAHEQTDGQHGRDAHESTGKRQNSGNRDARPLFPAEAPGIAEAEHICEDRDEKKKETPDHHDGRDIQVPAVRNTRTVLFIGTLKAKLAYDDGAGHLCPDPDQRACTAPFTFSLGFHDNHL